jgi:hypothetical protein
MGLLVPAGSVSRLEQQVFIPIGPRFEVSAAWREVWVFGTDLFNKA